MKPPALAFAVVAALSVAAVAAQQAPASRAFDVVSIKPNRSGRAEGGFRGSPGGRFEWTNAPVITLIQAAYQRFNFDEREIIGAPAWVSAERYDVIAQLGGPTPSVDPDGFPSQLLALFRGMLEERFNLRTHWDTREGQVYVMTVARPGVTGDKLRKIEAGCNAAMSGLTTGKPVAARPGRGPDCAFGGAPGTLVGNAVTMAMLGRVLGSWELHRPVIDRTGLEGHYDVDLRYRPQVENGPDATAGSELPSVFTAVQEQLGLKLAADRGPIDVQVIDRIERPSPD